MTELEQQLAKRSRTPGIAPPVTGGTATSTAPQTVTEPNVPPKAVASASAQDAKDAIEILQVQLQAKKAELQAVAVDLHSAQLNVGRVSSQAKSGQVNKEAVEIAQDKMARQKAAVQVKEAELLEFEVRLRQAARRLDQLQAAPAVPRTAPRGAERQQIREIRKTLEQLQQKLEALEKTITSRPEDAPRP